MAYTVVSIIHVIISLLLIATVLLQSGRSAGLSGAIAGGAEQVFGKKRGIDEVLARATAVLGVLFAVTSVALTVLH